MPKFEDWTLNTAQERVLAAMEERISVADYEVNRRFVEERDHWQGGEAWVGPTGGPALKQRVLAAVKPQFTPVDIINEVLGRSTNAVVKTEADVQFVPVEGEEEELTEQQETETSEMLAAISWWWDVVKFWEKTRRAYVRSRWGGKGELRSFIPAAMLDTRETTAEDGSVSATRVLPSNLPFRDALSRIRLEAEEPKTCAVVVDDDTLETIAVFLFKQGEQESAEIWRVVGDGVELRVLTPGGSTAYQFPVPFLPIAETSAEVLITEPVRQQQKRANFGESLLTRLMETAGFPERYTGNAQKEGEWVTSATAEELGNIQLSHLETKVIDGTTWYKLPRPRTLGASILTELVGLPVEDENGNTTGFSTPTITKFDPTDPQYAVTACQHARASILKDCRQAHVLGAENLQRSGISIVQARADFADDCTNAKAPLESMLRDILTAVIGWAGAMSSEFAGFLTRYRVVVNVKVNPGPLTPEERAQNAADVAAGLLSDETAMASAGIEDIDAERARIAASPMGQHAEAKRQWELAQVIGTATGFDAITCALLAGVPEEKLTEALAIARRFNAPATNGGDPAANGSRIPALTQ